MRKVLTPTYTLVSYHPVSDIRSLRKLIFRILFFKYPCRDVIVIVSILKKKKKEECA